MNSKFRYSLNSLAAILVSLLCAGAVAQEDPTQAGKTIIAKGQVTAIIEQNSRQLRRRSPVFLQDLVETGVASRTQMRMIDGGLLALQSESQIAIAEYEFNPDTLDGSVSMELLKGGLRTITGSLRQASGNYKLTTPVASIGVRGTHYEAELIEGDLHLAAWEGVIVVDVGSNSGQQFSLGDGQDYRFAVVTKDGNVNFLLNNPAAFADGHSGQGDGIDISTPQVDFAAASKPQRDQLFVFQPVFLTTGESPLDADTDAINYLLDSGALGVRTGQVIFNQIDQFLIQSNAGQVSDLSVSLQIDFDTASIPTGNLSFNDASGEWFAAFNGLLQAGGNLDLNINFSSHNNQLADGTIQSILIQQGTAILSNFDLSEINAPQNRAIGSFIVKEDAP